MDTPSFRILIIDDEPQIRRFLRASLSAHNYTIIEAPNAADGLRLAATEHPDVVVLDLGLPDMDGINLLQRLRDGKL
ncbi:MAG: response regulator, partial [Chlorobi bacterium CHB2]|nr:response regulator [Chlorobi bacterium CHB2]